MSRNLERAVVALLAAAVPLAAAAAGWLRAHSENENRLEAWNSYGAYIDRQLRRDEALERALGHCLNQLEGRAPGEDATEQLDELAERFGFDEGSSQ